MMIPSKSKGKSGTIVKGIIIAILLVAAGDTIYSEFFVAQEVAKSSNDHIAPTFILQDLEGNEYDLADYRGKGVLINFWGTYRPPCEKERPYLESAYQDYKDQGIEVLAINGGRTNENCE